MSAFLCSDRHIADIAVRYAEPTENIDPQDIANRLKVKANCLHSIKSPVWSI